MRTTRQPGDIYAREDIIFNALDFASLCLHIITEVGVSDGISNRRATSQSLQGASKRGNDLISRTLNLSPTVPELAPKTA